MTKSEKPIKKLTITKYADDSFDFNFGHHNDDKELFDDSDLLFIAALFKHAVNKSIRKGDKDIRKND